MLLYIAASVVSWYQYVDLDNLLTAVTVVLHWQIYVDVLLIECQLWTCSMVCHKWWLNSLSFIYRILTHALKSQSSIFVWIYPQGIALCEVVRLLQNRLIEVVKLPNDLHPSSVLNFKASSNCPALESYQFRPADLVWTESNNLDMILVLKLKLDTSTSSLMMSCWHCCFMLMRLWLNFQFVFCFICRLPITWHWGMSEWLCIQNITVHRHCSTYVRYIPCFYSTSVLYSSVFLHFLWCYVTGMYQILSAAL